MKDLDQLKKDYKQLGKTIAELESGGIHLTFRDIAIGETFTWAVCNVSDVPQRAFDGKQRIKVSSLEYVYRDGNDDLRMSQIIRDYIVKR